MSKLRNAYEKSVDWIYGIWFKAWVWQMGPLGIHAWVSEETVEKIHGALESAYFEMAKAQAEAETLRAANASLDALLDWDTVAKISGLEQTNAHLLRRNQVLIDEAEALKAQMGTVQRNFGTAFATPLTGPSRPNNNKKLTEREVADIRYFKRAGWTNKAIADTYDVNPATVSRIVRGQYHRAAS